MPLPLKLSVTYILFWTTCFAAQNCISQNTDTLERLSFTGDFRFRVEQDWNSRRSDGSYRTDRTRLRYRMRFGAAYQYNTNWSLGLRVRTGNPAKQQDPQLTLGKANEEFGTLPLGFEKIFVNGTFGGFHFWLGKNTFPFSKQNELFWSDNVFPEGIYLSHSFSYQSSLLNRLKIGLGHFIISSNNVTLDKDNYFQGFQMHTTHFDQRIDFFPSLYYFKNTPNIPDGGGTFYLDYAILHLGARVELKAKPLIQIELDYYQNLQDYQSSDSVQSVFRNQKTGFTGAVSFGQLKSARDWMLKLTYTHLEKYAAVDFMAQNDWARWDYSSFGSPDGRLTNFKGLEYMMGYMINQKLTLTMRSFFVNQLIRQGTNNESNSRVRLDLDIAF